MTIRAPVQLQGLAASAGIAVGRARRLRTSKVDTAAAGIGTPDQEIAKLTAAVEQARIDLTGLRDRTREKLGGAKAEIFDVHLSFLNDPEFIDVAARFVSEEFTSASKALLNASAGFIDILENSGDEVLTERVIDLRDVTLRLQRLLSGQSYSTQVFDEDVILIAEDLTPSDTAQLDLHHVRGVVTARGSLTSHSVILARAMQLPAIVGLTTALEIPEDSTLLIDADTGIIRVDPDRAMLEAARKKLNAQAREQAAFEKFTKLPSVTADGKSIALSANIGQLAHLDSALAQGAEGVGLLRTEFIYLDRPTLPDEESLYRMYRHALQKMAPHPVTVRTLDAGGDKRLPGAMLAEEENPFLGVRGLRLCLSHEDLFRVQLRALLRASVHGNLKVMFPMVAVSSEIRAAKQMLMEETTALCRAGHPVSDQIEIGIVLEIPAAILLADQLAKEVDFFSIGSNDLTQYTMAADRTNERLAYLQAAYHPAILRLIHTAVEAAHRHGKWIGVCGEMGGDPIALPILAGLGLDELSMHPGLIARNRAMLSRIDTQTASALASSCLNFDSSDAVRQAVYEAFPGILKND